MRPSQRIQELAYGRARLQEAKTNACVEKFGHALFGTFLHKAEPDTKIEREIFRTVEAFVEGNSHKPEIIKAFKSLMACMKQYPDVLEPKLREIYRGKVVKLDDLRQYVPKSIDDYKRLAASKPLRIDSTGYVKVTDNYKYTPRFEVQSWTTSLSVAAKFAQGGAVFDTHVPAILYGNLPKAELLFNPTFINKLARSVLGSSEDEVVRVGKTLKCTLYVPLDSLVEGFPFAPLDMLNVSSKQITKEYPIDTIDGIKDLANILLASGYDKASVQQFVKWAASSKSREDNPYLDATAEFITDLKDLMRVANKLST